MHICLSELLNEITCNFVRKVEVIVRELWTFLEFFANQLHIPLSWSAKEDCFQVRKLLAGQLINFGNEKDLLLQNGCPRVNH
jgi:hypothetical protein